MAKYDKALTALAVKNAKPKDKTYRMFDGGGLYLEVTPSGGRYWRMKYRFGGKHKVLAFGVYPVISLSVARRSAMEAKRVISAGADPSAVGTTSAYRLAAQSLNAKNGTSISNSGTATHLASTNGSALRLVSAVSQKALHGGIVESTRNTTIDRIERLGEILVFWTNRAIKLEEILLNAIPDLQAIDDPAGRADDLADTFSETLDRLASENENLKQLTGW